MFSYRAVFLHFTCCILLLTAISSCSSGSKKNRPSPLASDSTYIEGADVSIHYSSPGVKKRKIWGELVPYNEIWRTGANEATVFQTANDIFINGKRLKSGKYAVFTITSDTTWTVIFNKDWDQWGAYDYHEEEDALRLVVQPQQSDFTERMKFFFENQSLVFEWENLSYSLEIDPVTSGEVYP